jgi:hemoglobin
VGEAPTLYEWAGGREAIERMIDRFYDRVEHDDLLSPLFPRRGQRCPSRARHHLVV